EPRFSWVLKAKDASVFAQKQTAYRVLVASNSKNMRNGTGDMWDSGWVSSADMGQIIYAGTPLLSDRTYYWKVAIKDQDQKESKWSATAKWSTGVLDGQWNGQWNGQWIGGSEVFNSGLGDNNIWDPWLRKDFELKS